MVGRRPGRRAVTAPDELKASYCLAVSSRFTRATPPASACVQVVIRLQPRNYKLGMTRAGASIDRDAWDARADTSSMFAQNRASVARLRRAVNDPLNITFALAHRCRSICGPEEFPRHTPVTGRPESACVQVASRTHQAGRNSAVRCSVAALRLAAAVRKFLLSAAQRSSRFGAYCDYAVEFFPRPRSRVGS